MQEATDVLDAFVRTLPARLARDIDRTNHCSQDMVTMVVRGDKEPSASTILTALTGIYPHVRQGSRVAVTLPDFFVPAFTPRGSSVVRVLVGAPPLERRALWETALELWDPVDSSPSLRGALAMASALES